MTCAALEQAALLAGWDHAAAVPVFCPVQPLPKGWSACLSYACDQHTPARSIRDVFMIIPLAREIAAYLRGALAQADQAAVVFYEWFKPLTLTAFVLAQALLPHRKFKVWVLFRGNALVGPRRFAYWLLVRLLGWLTGPRVVLLTDNAHIIPELSRWFGQPVKPAPIPHSTDPHQHVSPDWVQSMGASRLVCWWPGSPRPEKGGEIIRALARDTSPGAQGLCLVASRDLGLEQTAGGCRVVAVDDSLPRDDYFALLSGVDVVLLPYTPGFYRNTTSGIFVEAIVAGKVALTSAGTWSANELLRFDLGELIMDWNRQDLPAEIMRLARDPDARLKLEIMSAAYQAYHSPAGFAEMLREI